MEAAGLGLAIYGTIDITLRYGVKLVDACKTYHNAKSEIQVLTNSIESTWYRIREQVERLRETCEDLEPEFIRHQDNLLMELISKLSLVEGKLCSLSNGSRKVRLEYVFIKKRLNAMILSLDAWQHKFDPGWYLIPKEMKEMKSALKLIANDHGSKALETAKQIQVALSTEDSTGLQNIFRKPLKDEHVQLTSIDRSTAKVLRDTIRVDGIYVVDPLRCPQAADAEELESDVRALARKLRAIDSARFSMLQCSGVQRKRSEAGGFCYELLFKFPENASGEPTSLAALIASADMKWHSLTERLRIAQQLTRAVCYVQTLDFVHKNIRPESVLAFQQTGTTLGSVYLVGFEMFRRDDGATRMRGDTSWERNVYRHPERQGDHPETKHTMQHDIYSLGVCLLEIGLWRPIMPLVAAVKTTCSDSHDTMEVQGSMLLPSEQVKTEFESLAEKSLPSMMGDQYRDVVVNCLTCLDADNVDFADTTVSTGLKYIERACRHLLLYNGDMLTLVADPIRDGRYKVLV